MAAVTRLCAGTRLRGEVSCLCRSERWLLAILSGVTTDEKVFVPRSGNVYPSVCQSAAEDSIASLSGAFSRARVFAQLLLNGCEHVAFH